MRKEQKGTFIFDGRRWIYTVFILSIAINCAFPFRYTLYEIPFYKERLQELRIFSTAREINEYLTPFQASQLQKKIESEQ